MTRAAAASQSDSFGALSEADRAALLRLLDSLDEAAQQLIAAPAAPGTPVVPA
jgi:hypothetical protein